MPVLLGQAGGPERLEMGRVEIIPTHWPRHGSGPSKVPTKPGGGSRSWEIRGHRGTPLGHLRSPRALERLDPAL